MVNNVFTPMNVGSPAKVLRRYAGTRPDCQSWQCNMSGRNRRRATPKAARAKTAKRTWLSG